MTTYTAYALSSGNSESFIAKLIKSDNDEALFLIEKDKVESFYIRGTYNYAEDCWIIPMGGNEINGITMKEMRIYDNVHDSSGKILHPEGALK
jgi:hypothetical protein